MKIREICNCSRRSETHSGALTHLEIEALATWLVENLFDEIHRKLVIAPPSVAADLEPHRRRRRKRPLAAGPGGIGSPPRNDVAAAPAADARAGGAVGAAAAAPVAMGGPTLG
jgi:hypothetical protein